MVMIFKSPAWFMNAEILIDLFAIFVCFLIVYKAFRHYKFNRHRQLLYFCIGFLFMATALVAKTLLHSGIYYNLFLKVEHINELHYFTTEILPIDILNTYTAFIFIWMTWWSIFLLYTMMVRNETRLTTILAFLFLALLSWYLTNPSVFHILSALMLFLITFRYFEQYFKSSRRNLLYPLVSFGILTLSQVLFIFKNNPIQYVMAEILQLVGFFGLLIVLMRLGRSEYINK